MRAPSRSRTRSNVGPAGHRRDASGHLRVDDDAAGPEQHRPRERHPEARAGRGVRDDVADVDEAADRGEDAEHDADELLHASPVIRAPSRTGRGAVDRRGSGLGLPAKLLEVGSTSSDPERREHVARLVEERGRAGRGADPRVRRVAGCPRTSPVSSPRRSPPPRAAPRRRAGTPCPRSRPAPRAVRSRPTSGRSSRCSPPSARSRGRCAPVLQAESSRRRGR